MALANYSDLSNAVADWIERADLAARIPDFVTLAESKLNRKLKCRQMEQRTQATIDLGVSEPQFITLPSDFQTMRSIRLSSVTGKPELAYKSKVQLDQLRYKCSDSTGRPLYFTVLSSAIELLPTPDSAYVVEMLYRTTLPGLQANTTNWLMTAAPDLYLYATLMESAPYLKEDERVPLWSAAYENALQEVNDLSMDSTFNAGPLSISYDGPTP